MEKRNRRILRCPVCTMGRIADAPMEADLSQYHLFGMREGEYADLIAKCPKCSAQIGIAVSHCPGVSAVTARPICGAARIGR